MKKKYILLTLLIVLFTLLCLSITQNDIIFVDNFYNLLYFHNFITTIMKIITFLGSAYVVIGITILILFINRNKLYGLLCSINLFLITIFQYILKNIFERSRPADINLIEESGFSFPSGHTLTAVAFYGLLIYFIYNSNLKRKKLYITLLSILIILIGLSRIYLGVHYTSDVLGGIVFSSIYLIIFISIIEKNLK